MKLGHMIKYKISRRLQPVSVIQLEKIQFFQNFLIKLAEKLVKNEKNFRNFFLSYIYKSPQKFTDFECVVRFLICQKNKKLFEKTLVFAYFTYWGHICPTHKIHIGTVFWMGLTICNKQVLVTLFCIPHKSISQNLSKYQSQMRKS